MSGRQGTSSSRKSSFVSVNWIAKCGDLELTEGEWLNLRS
jgi:hypothetical protein